MQSFLWHVADVRKAIKLELSLDGFSLSTLPSLAFLEAQLPPFHNFIQTFSLGPLVFQCFKSLLSPPTGREFLIRLPFRSLLGRLMNFMRRGERRCDPRALFQRSRELCLRSEATSLQGHAAGGGIAASASSVDSV